MNARRVHALMREKFPSPDLASLDWTNVVDELGCLSKDSVLPLVVRPFEERGIQEVLVQVHRKLGGTVATRDLVQYLADHLGQGEIRMADRDFSVLALLAVNGVAACWGNEQA